MSKSVVTLIADFYHNIRSKIPVRKILGLKPKDYYWEDRSQFHYYQVVKSWIEEFSPGNLIIDIGGSKYPSIDLGAIQAPNFG